jgi:hypothetical protein
MTTEIAFAVIIVAIALAGVYILLWTRKEERKQEGR